MCSSTKKRAQGRGVHLLHCSEGGSETDALVRGNLLTATVEAAKRYVQGVTAPDVKSRRDLEVILLDAHGKEIFRYLTSPAAKPAADARVSVPVLPKRKRVRLSRR